MVFKVLFLQTPEKRQIYVLCFTITVSWRFELSPALAKLLFTLYGKLSLFSTPYPPSPTFDDSFYQHQPNEMRDKHKNKLMRENYFFMFRGQGAHAS